MVVMLFLGKIGVLDSLRCYPDQMNRRLEGIKMCVCVYVCEGEKEGGEDEEADQLMGVTIIGGGHGFQTVASSNNQ